MRMGARSEGFLAGDGTENGIEIRTKLGHVSDWGTISSVCYYPKAPTEAKTWRRTTDSFRTSEVQTRG